MIEMVAEVARDVGGRSKVSYCCYDLILSMIMLCYLIGEGCRG